MSQPARRAGATVRRLKGAGVRIAQATPIALARARAIRARRGGADWRRKGLRRGQRFTPPTQPTPFRSLDPPLRGRMTYFPCTVLRIVVSRMRSFSSTRRTTPTCPRRSRALPTRTRTTATPTARLLRRLGGPPFRWNALWRRTLQLFVLRRLTSPAPPPSGIARHASAPFTSRPTRSSNSVSKPVRRARPPPSPPSWATLCGAATVRSRVDRRRGDGFGTDSETETGTDGAGAAGATGAGAGATAYGVG
jgi:hypothetical protein